VKERLGYASIATTEKYLHSLPTADETALDALSRIRQLQAAGREVGMNPKPPTDRLGVGDVDE
jgi:hypothetical protein